MTAPEPPAPAAETLTEAEPITLTIEVIARLWREHLECTWLSTGVNVMWSCGIWHPGPIHMQPTTRDRHLAALVLTQVEADRAIARRRSIDRLAAQRAEVTARLGDADVVEAVERVLPLDFERHESQTIKDAAIADRRRLARAALAAVRAVLTDGTGSTDG